jgi:hypothetical protein
MNNSENAFRSEQSIESGDQRQYHEQLLWDKASDLDSLKKGLQQRLAELDAEFTEKPTHSLNLHQRELRAAQENEYWRLKEKIDEISAEENRVQKVLEDIGNDRNVDLKELNTLIKQPTREDQTKLSKRKQRILEEKQRSGIDPREINYFIWREFGSDAMALTTGRHAKGVKNLGNVSPDQASNEFFYRTADTHGGKVDHGKKGNMYVTKSGKRIRKR